VVLDRLDRAGRPWTVAVQSSGIAGILAALDAGLAITIFPESSLPDALKPIGNAAALPPLPDFEFVLRRSAVRSSAVDHLALMIANFFQLSAALRPGAVADNKAHAHLAF
jgi:DNA-binding transcriptional LysR family regulator